MAEEELRIDKIFDAKAHSILKIFTGSGANMGFSIPLYQRFYRWGDLAINRLILSVVEGINSLEDDSSSVSFIGTIICVEENNRKGFDGKVLSVVDGQQRLTTISLLCCLLHQKLDESMSLLCNDELRALLGSEYKQVSKRLLASVAGTYSDFDSGHENHFPKIIRDKIDDWNIDEREYQSPVSSYLYQYIKYHCDKDITSFKYKVIRSDIPHDYFIRNIGIIDKSLKEIFDGKFEVQSEDSSDDMILPSYEDLSGNERLKNVLLSKIDFSSENKRLIKSHPDDKAVFVGLLYLLSFSNFLLNRVALTSVTVSDDKYAFDIFEALNTTGEPLTAVETLKPFVVNAEDEMRSKEGGYFRSDSKIIFDNIEEYLDKKDFPETKHKQVESSELVLSLALLYDGKKESKQLGSQRTYLRSRYENLSYKNKLNFLKLLDGLIEFKNKFWISGCLGKQLATQKDRDIILFCLAFIRDMNNTMAIPPLSRYYISSNRFDMNDFFEAVKATTAFLVIWRAFFGTTNGIDSKYRELMIDGCKKVPGSKPISCGKGFKNKLPSINEYKICLKGFLDARGLLDKKKWTDGVVDCSIYDKSKPVSKFMLLVSAHNTGLKNGSLFLLEKERKGHHKSYMSLTQWESNDFKTIEHVAPQNPINKDDWDKKIFEKNLLDTIGNLTLLPEKENSTVGNHSWKRKQKYYRAFSEDKLSEIDKYIVEAKKSGVDFGKKTIAMLKSGSSLPTIAHIANIKQWNAKVISERSKNITELVWDEMISWLD